MHNDVDRERDHPFTVLDWLDAAFDALGDADGFRHLGHHDTGGLCVARARTAINYARAMLPPHDRAGSSLSMEEDGSAVDGPPSILSQG